MRSRSGNQSSFAWPLVKAAAIWFIVAQLASIVAPTIDTSPKVFGYLAIAGFGVQVLGLLLGSVMSYGFSWRLGVIAAVCLAVGAGIFSSLPDFSLDGVPGADWITRRIESEKNAVKTPNREPAPDKTTAPRDQLGRTAELIFEKETQESLAKARQYLLSIAVVSPMYKNAQALLKIVELRLSETDPGNDAQAKKKRPLQAVSVEQTGHGLRVALRNNTDQIIRNIHYRISYFRAADGSLIEPDKESLILIDIPPAVTRNFELNDERLKLGVYGAFQLFTWDLEPVDQEIPTK